MRTKKSQKDFKRKNNDKGLQILKPLLSLENKWSLKIDCVYKKKKKKLGKMASKFSKDKNDIQKRH